MTRTRKTQTAIDNPALVAATQARQRAEYELAQARGRRPLVNELVQRAERAVERNGFGEAIELAMRPRPKED